MNLLLKADGGRGRGRKPNFVGEGGGGEVETESLIL